MRKPINLTTVANPEAAERVMKTLQRQINIRRYELTRAQIELDQDVADMNKIKALFYERGWEFPR